VTIHAVSTYQDFRYLVQQQKHMQSTRIVNTNTYRNGKSSISPLIELHARLLTTQHLCVIK